MISYRLGAAAAGLDLRRVEEPIPEPGRGQILVRMRAASLNFRDLLIRQGRYGPGLLADVVSLSDGCGEVVATGPEVTRFRQGDRVTPTFSARWMAGPLSPETAGGGLGGAVDGVLREYLVCDEQAAVAAPAHLSDQEAACFTCAGVTAWAALFGPRPVRPGETVLTLGLGGVSSFAIAFAKAAGARVIATSSSDAKLDVARRLGAAETINYRAHEAWQDRVLALTNGRGVDHVVEIGGGGTLPRSIASTAIGGQIHMIGVLTLGQIDPLTLMGGKTLRAIAVGSRDDHLQMNRLVAQHQLRPEIDSVFSFEDATGAFDRLASGQHVGKVVIDIAS